MLVYLEEGSDSSSLIKLLQLHCKIQGDHKKRAKYRFASKTLMRLLPANIKKEVEDLIETKSISLDLYDVLGQCTWGQNRLDKEASDEKSKVSGKRNFLIMKIDI